MCLKIEISDKARSHINEEVVLSKKKCFHDHCYTGVCCLVWQYGYILLKTYSCLAPCWKYK